ncbi:MAG TPA: hypothetical protein VGK18_10980 [Propionicimonas sp.]|uniref:hypothetical protein n=1 Tax=Propionicimonas sp. TaxID=1955623 RepID=UPI002F400226
MQATITSTRRTFPVDNEGNVMRGDAAAAYLRAIAGGMPRGGVDVFQRTWEEQKAVYRAFLRGTGPRAAKPSWDAPHIDARAFDTHTTTAGEYRPSEAHTWLTRGGDGSSRPRPGESLRAHEYGFRRSVPSERWHFEYNRDQDVHRAADLAARLKALGFATVKAFQLSAGLDDDGRDGPRTWAALLGADYPEPDEPARALVEEPAAGPAGPVDFRAATYNVQLQHFGGGPYSEDATFVEDTLRASVLACQEADEAARDSIREATGFKVWAYKTLGIFWDPDKYDNGDRIELDLGTRYHGMIGTTLTSRKNGNSFIVASVHIRPKDAFRSAADAIGGKKADIARVIARLEGNPRVLVGGDWSSNAKDQMEAAGYHLVTPYVDTYDEGGNQHLDAVFAIGLDERAEGREHATSASDHDGLVARLTLPAPL